MFNIRPAALIAMLIMTPSAFAAETNPGYTLTPGIGLIDFDNNRQFDNDPFWSIAGGYRFAGPWATELRFSSVDSKSSNSGQKATADYLSLDALYHLDTDSSVKPYLVFGVGEVSLDSGGNSNSESIIDLGAGLTYPLSENSAVRSDLRIFRETAGAKNSDVAITIGYQFQFDNPPAAPIFIDDDNDGVANSDDQCPGTAASVLVDSKGCVIDGDNDNDGVRNSIDLCPNSAAGENVDASGCRIDGDSDQDGVADSIDECANTKIGVAVDSKGCAIDDDNDGVMNPQDKCPDTPAGIAVNADGCPDDDGDGVRNGQDKCPQTPLGVEVDSNGCGADADMDGIPNHRDQCPKTFPPALVDEEGCFVILDEIVRITLDVEFDFDSNASRPEHAAEVQKVAEFMAKYPLTEVVLEGHTDSQGSEEYNLSLSAQRAHTIGEMLKGKFSVDAARITTVGYGELRPIASNDSAENRQRNRRVVAEISAMEQVKKRISSN